VWVVNGFEVSCPGHMKKSSLFESGHEFLDDQEARDGRKETCPILRPGVGIDYM
jgi:hypothetical protein